MPGHQIERWFAPIVSGVGYLHESGLVHRDLKPANIFLDEDENVIKIGDYGLSKFISSSKGSGQTETVGTFHYMAPEIGKGIYGKGIDIYAMGIVLYEMLTGDVPFDGESSHEIIMKHMTTNPDLREIPFDYKEVIRRSLVKDPEVRFATVNEMIEFLPWAGDSPRVRVGGGRSPRFDTSVMPESRPQANAERRSSPAKVTEVFQRSAYEKGILFGPLKDSQVNSAPQEIVYLQKESQQNGHSPVANGKNRPTKTSKPAPWWRVYTKSVPLKVILLLLMGGAIASNSSWLFIISMVIGLAFVAHFAYRNFVEAPDGQELKSEKLEARKKQQLILKRIREKIATYDFVTHATHLTGALLVSALVCLALHLLGLAIVDSIFESSIQSWTIFTWAVTVSILSRWGMLFVGQMFDIGDEDWVSRRFAMLSLGALVGGCALLLGGFYGVDFNANSAITVNPLASTYFSIQGAAPLLVNVLFFSGVFGMVRWWKLVDPSRKSKLSLVSIAMCLVWAAVFSHVLNFAPLLNCMLVVIVAVAVQLAAPWISIQKRQELIGG